MAKLLVLNPVINMLLGENFSTLIDFLEQEWHVRSASSGKNIVLEDTRCYIENYSSTSPIIDSRCPIVTEMVEYEFPELMRFLSPISPILISGAWAEKRLFTKDYGEPTIFKIITPCTALKEKYKYFSEITETWKEFKKSFHINLPEKKLETSPVPPGFFKPLNLKTIEANGEDEVREILKNFHKLPLDTKIVELLGCKDGCINGDGL